MSLALARPNESIDQIHTTAEYRGPKSPRGAKKALV